VIPKYHGEKLTDIPDDALTEILVRLQFPIPALVPRWKVNEKGREAERGMGVSLRMSADIN
jgi:hypothetical protein